MFSVHYLSLLAEGGGQTRWESTFENIQTSQGQYFQSYIYQKNIKC